MPGYISEFDYFGTSDQEFVEIAVPTGTDISSYSLVFYQWNGTIYKTVSLGTYAGTISGQDVYVVDQSTPGFDSGGDPTGTFYPDDAIALVDDSGTVLQFVSWEGNTVNAIEGPANGISSTNAGVAAESLQSDDGGSTYYAQSTSNKGTIPCYAAGTMIDTPGGPRAVETLSPGDLVQTVDHGPQPIRWVRSSDHALEETQDEDKPVLIQAGALGTGRPAHNLIVSPQHRILVGGAGQLTQYFDAQTFAPAKALTGLPGIRHMKGKTDITWVHFACDRHEVVMANGCYSESLLLGPLVLNGLSHTERAILKGIFGPAFGDRAGPNGPAIHNCLKVVEVRRHLAKCKDSKDRHHASEITKWDIDLAMERYEANRLQEAVA